MSTSNTSEKKDSLFVWTRNYYANRFNFSLVGFYMKITSETIRYDLGHGYYGYIVTCNKHNYYKGRSVVVEESSGGVIGDSLRDAKLFISANLKSLPRQIEENSKRLKHDSLEQFFWEAYYR